MHNFFKALLIFCVTAAYTYKNSLLSANLACICYATTQPLILFDNFFKIINRKLKKRNSGEKTLYRNFLTCLREKCIFFQALLVFCVTAANHTKTSYSLPGWLASAIWHHLQPLLLFKSFLKIIN